MTFINVCRAKQMDCTLDMMERRQIQLLAPDSEARRSESHHPKGYPECFFDYLPYRERYIVVLREATEVRKAM